MLKSEKNPVDVFIALNAIRFASYATAQAAQFGPQAGAGLLAAKKIFGIVDVHSEIDPLGESARESVSSSKDTQGLIEFKDVWFRYPSRPDHWVLKGINL